MARKPGTPKTGGRSRGTPNKISIELRTKINDFLAEKWPNIEADFSKLEPYQRLQFFEKLLPYVLPRLRENDLKVDFALLTDEDINRVVGQILNDENTY